MLTALFRIYQIFIMCPLIAVSTIVTATVTVFGVTMGWGRTWGYYPEIIWARLFCWLNFVSVSVKGRENINPGTSYVFTPNHQSAYDIFSIYGYLGHNFRWMMKQSLRTIPFVGWACARSGQIFVDNSSVSATRRTMSEAEKQLSGGMSLVVFPEGARTWDGNMRRFKKGAFKLAQEFRLPIVPVTIEGAFEVMPRFKKLPLPGHITLTIHAPIAPPADEHDITRVMDEVYGVVKSGLTPR